MNMRTSISNVKIGDAQKKKIKNAHVHADLTKQFKRER